MTHWVPTLLFLALIQGCASLPPEPIIQFQTVEIVRDRYIKPPAWMTVPVEIVQLPDDFLTLSDVDALIAMGIAIKAGRVRAQQCNGQLAEIAELGE